jgi:hypothetical protein
LLFDLVAVVFNNTVIFEGEKTITPLDIRFDKK